MRELDYGSIIDMSLVSWMRGMPLLEAYAAAKAAMPQVPNLNQSDTTAREGGHFDAETQAGKPLGAELIAQEQAIDQLFAKGEITP
jgi:hypothetical protein